MDYEVTSPDGKRFIVSAPEGASQNDVLSYAQSQFKAQPAAKESASLTPGDVIKGIGNYYKNVNMGALKGAANIGATILSAGDKLSNAATGNSGQTLSSLVTGKEPISPSQERRQKIGEFFNENADPQSLAFRGGELGTEIAGTAGIGGALAKGVQAIPAIANAIPKLAPALESGGFNLGGAPATTLAGRAGDLATRIGAGGVVGGVTAGVIDPQQAGTGAAIGAALPPAVKVAGTAGNAVRSLFEPLYQGGRERILGRALNEAVGPAAPQVVSNLQNARVLVPGSQPTAAEVANSGGMAAIQRAASAVDPEAYATRAAQQNEARVNNLLDLAGTSGQRDFYAENRDATAKQLYKQAYDKGVDITRDPATGQFLPKAQIAGRKGEITKLLKRPAIQDAVQEARTLAQNEGVKIDATGSVKGLDYVKRALDDQIGKATGNEQRILIDLKDRLLTTLDKLSPDYEAARNTFQEMSRPINQMDIAQELANKSINPLTGALQPQAYARNLTDDMAARATGFNKATLGGILEPQQLAQLNAIKEDLARSVAARDLGRGAGSDTVQKLAMTNLLQQTGLPLGLLNMPGIGRAGNWLYSHADAKMKQQLAQDLLDPQKAALLMQAARNNPQLSKAIQNARLLAIPLATTGANP